MDEMVRLALAKWPDVPDCFGWLALDGRGRWRIGAERELISHAPTIGFIARNYLVEPQGRWYFQNGPQRVYVHLDYTPFVWRFSQEDQQCWLTDQTGLRTSEVDRVFIDDGGQFLCLAAGRIGVLHDHDSQLMIEQLRTGAGQPLGDEALVEAIDSYIGQMETGLTLLWSHTSERIRVESIARHAVPARFRFDPEPSRLGLPGGQSSTSP